ncbi:MAG: group II intron reverse transcriptase/maturase [Bacillota bacterium]|nr:group II intron reverse transcriptase/maturase [Bacillota bacterium]
MSARELSNVSTKQQRIAELAKQLPDVCFTSLTYHMDLEWMREAYRQTRKDGAVGVDQVTAEEYEANLDENLANLLEQAKAGTYFAPPVRRVYIPKGGNREEMRPIGIPTLEDKVLQRAVKMLLEPLFEQDFLECSYGFRPGRSPHQALQSIWQEIMGMRGGWIIDVDIQKYFDTIDHGHLREIIGQRVNDGVIRRLIGKWLNAGVQEDGNISFPETGSPQGGVISPLLSNIYLHKVLDVWFKEMVKPRMKGKVFMTRFADDVILGFEKEEDARKVLEVLPKRCAKFGLTLHPEKTRLVQFISPQRGSEKPSSFDFLGFTHYWDRSRKKNWIVKRKTEKKRLSRKIKEVREWCRQNRHGPIREQHATLVKKLKGHFQYYGITNNGPSLGYFRIELIRAWRKWLNRRTHKGRYTWEAFLEMLRFLPLPQVRIVHSAYSAKP